MTLKNLNIVIVEDHDALREGFVEYLRNQALNAIGLCCGEDLDEYLINNNPEILILDIGLPGENGFEIAQRMRASHPNIYIMLLTALDTSNDKIRGYQAGADLYLPKPVSAAELTAAIQAAARRILIAEAPNNHLQVSLSQSKLLGNNKSVDLNHQEKLLLKSLAEAQEQMLPTWRLLEVLTTATGSEAEKSYLELQIFRLRKKLLEAGAPKPAIKAVWKEGYKLLQAVQLLA